MSLKPKQRRLLEEEAQRNPGGPAAQILKNLAQEEAKAIDLMRQASEQAKKDMTRQKILIGVAVLSECEKNPTFRERFEKVLSRHLTATRDKEIMSRFGWEMENENTENSINSAPAATE